jgi:predicted glycoside hydrolase/deacetylase ChbG (UPF0249 family)
MNSPKGRAIVFRADDAGSSEGANHAILRTVRDGVVRNVGFMVPGPSFTHAVELLRDLEGIDFGLHVTLNAEWENVKWGPVSPATVVPSLVERDGWFTSAPSVLNDRGFSIDEAMAEVEAQLSAMRAAGLRVDYLDEHMGVGWLPGLRARLVELCERERILYAGSVPYLEGSQAQDVEALLATIEDAGFGPHVVVGHPGSDTDPLMRQFTFGGLRPGEIQRERAQDRRVLTDPRLVTAVERGEIESLTYSAAASRRD